MSGVNRNINDLKPGPCNRVVHNGRVETLMVSIRDDGLLNPLIIDENDRIIDGTQRCEALKRLGYVTVPCLIKSETDDSVFGGTSDGRRT